MKKIFLIVLLMLSLVTSINAQDKKNSNLSNPLGTKVQKLKQAILSNQLTLIEGDFSQILKEIEPSESEDEDERLIVERKKFGNIYEVSLSTIKRSEGGLTIEVDTQRNTLTITAGNKDENIIFVDKKMDGVIDELTLNLKEPKLEIPEDATPDQSQRIKETFEKEMKEYDTSKTLLEANKQKSYKILIKLLLILFDID